MTTQTSFFLRDEITAHPPTFLMMELPLDFCSFDIEEMNSGTGFVNGAAERPIKWERVREFDAGGISEDDALRFGQAVDLVRVEVGSEQLTTPCFILVDKHLHPRRYRILAELEYESSFDTAVAQANVWLSVYGELAYGDLMGSLDRDFVARSKKRQLQPGDALVVECVGDERALGILILNQQFEARLWESDLYVASDAISDLVGCKIVSVHQTAIDGFRAAFRRLFGRVQSVNESAVLETL